MSVLTIMWLQPYCVAVGNGGDSECGAVGRLPSLRLLSGHVCDDRWCVLKQRPVWSSGEDVTGGGNTRVGTTP